MPSYSYATLADAQNALAARLYDSSFQQWNATELTGYLVEALQTWNALSTFWRDTMQFSTAANVPWYDLTQQTGTLVPYGGTQNQLIVQIENHLLEPPTTAYPLTWAGSSQFSIQDLLDALTQRENETMGETGCTLARILVTASETSRRTSLTGTVIDLRRLAWLPTPPSAYVNRPMHQSDLWANRAFSASWLSAAAAPPSTYILNSTPPVSFDVDTLPPVPGQYEALVTSADVAWSASANSTIVVPTDWTWVVKWGALFSLMSREMWAQDPLRMDYCLKRYREGLSFLANLPSVFGASITTQNETPLAVDALRDADNYNPLWQAASLGPPAFAYTSGNLLAFSPPPDAAYAVSVTVVQNAPLPSAPGDFLQVAQDDYDTVLDYAQHLALFKSGGQEFAATIPLYQKFQEKAALYNGKLKEFGIFTLPQLDISQREGQRRPRYAPGADPKAA